jgi:hypothetical protein
MKIANVNKTDDLNYKGGFVECVCGWKEELGNGFNGYHIDNCPVCTPELETRNQHKVTVGKPNNYTVTLGNHIYFILSNGINVQFSKTVYSTFTGLSEKQADKIA